MSQVLLLDLGNVVMETDFRRVFAAWAKAADVDVQRFYDRWEADSAYEQHEVGAVTFEQYADALTNRFGVDLTVDQWRDGWNALFTEVYGGVISRLQTIGDSVPLYAFSNTNRTHVECFLDRFGDSLAVFRTVYLSSSIGLRKPDVAAYHHIAGDVGAAPENITFLDDNRDNIEGALAAGLNAIRVHGEAEVCAALDRLYPT